ncbi:MAG TPA: hypothetical protein VF403_18815 [Kofleriaceae bacterium]
MMKLGLAIVVLFVAACVDPAPTPKITIDTGPPLHLTENAHGATTQIDAVQGSQAEPVEVDGSACSCTTSECITDWIESTVGPCVCADLVCNDGRRIGACVACTP